jgi:hypothetical protein
MVIRFAIKNVGTTDPTLMLGAAINGRGWVVSKWALHPAGARRCIPRQPALWTRITA